MNHNQIDIPKIFWGIAITTLLWNLVCSVGFFSDLLVTAEDISAMSTSDRKLYLSHTIFHKVALGLGVLGGLLGSISLLLKKSWCITFFLVSLLGAIIQLILNITVSDMVGILGVSSLMLPAVTILIAAFLYWYSRLAKAQGILG